MKLTPLADRVFGRSPPCHRNGIKLLYNLPNPSGGARKKGLTQNKKTGHKSCLDQKNIMKVLWKVHILELVRPFALGDQHLQQFIPPQSFQILIRHCLPLPSPLDIPLY